jgi:DNA invertase Pin-like site-specific DNA recombinase
MAKRGPRPPTDLFIGYVRVSTEEQAVSGLGMQAQREAIAREAKRKGWEIRWIEDAGYSGKSLKRPGITEALEALRKGEAAGLITAKQDRLSRSSLDFALILDRSQREGWTVVALDIRVDTSTPAGEFVASVMAASAQQERRLIGERTRLALAAKKAQGFRLGRPPVLPRSVVRRIIRLRDGGAGWSEIGRRLDADCVPTAQGGKLWYPATVRSVYFANTKAA